MHDKSTIALLWEALEFLNAQPRFCMRSKRSRKSYDLAARIQSHLDRLQMPSHTAVVEARRRWASSGFIRVSLDETEFESTSDGYWVRGWIKIGRAVTGDIEPSLRAQYDAAVEKLPLVTREVFDAHRLEGRSPEAIALRLGISVEETEQLIAEALIAIGRALR